MVVYVLLTKQQSHTLHQSSPSSTLLLHVSKHHTQDELRAQAFLAAVYTVITVIVVITMSIVITITSITVIIACVPVRLQNQAECIQRRFTASRQY